MHFGERNTCQGDLTLNERKHVYYRRNLYYTNKRKDRSEKIFANL